MGVFDAFLNLFGKKENVGHTLAARVEKKEKPVLPDRFTTLEEIEKAFEALALQQYFEAVKPGIRDKIDLELQPANDNDLSIGASRIGGQPDLPSGMPWPVDGNTAPLSFIGQLNCAELSLSDGSGLLPKTGLLSFFYSAEQDAWGFDPKDKDSFRVLYFEDMLGIHPVDFPSGLEEHARYTPNAIKIYKALSLPDWENHAVRDLLNEEETDTYFELAAGGENQMLGYAGTIQSTMELECQLVTNGLYCGDAVGYNDPRAKLLEEGAKDWLLLLQIGSEDEKTGMMWGDVGRIYFWIRKQDLAARHFDKTWCILQCS